MKEGPSKKEEASPLQRGKDRPQKKKKRDISPNKDIRGKVQSGEGKQPLQTQSGDPIFVKGVRQPWDEWGGSPSDSRAERKKGDAKVARGEKPLGFTELGHG